MLWLFGVIVTLTWGPPCGAEWHLARGTPVEPETKAQTRLSIVKTIPAGVCTASEDLGPGVYVHAIWIGQGPPTYAMGESNRTKTIIYPNGTMWTDSPGSVIVLPTPTNLRIP